jgi:hypothetical protein
MNPYLNLAQGDGFLRAADESFARTADERGLALIDARPTRSHRRAAFGGTPGHGWCAIRDSFPNLLIKRVQTSTLSALYQHLCQHDHPTGHATYHMLTSFHATNHATPLITSEPSRIMRRGCPANRGFMDSWSSSGSTSIISTAAT